MEMRINFSIQINDQNFITDLVLVRPEPAKVYNYF